MSRIIRRKETWISVCVGVLISVLSLWIWVRYTNPFPDRDSLHQLFFPYLNSLKLAGEFSWDPFFLKSAFLYTYPWGLALLSSILGLLGLSSLAFASPWHLPALFCAPLALVSAFQDLSRRDRFLFFLTLLYCPVVQIAMKSYSLHGLITLLVLPGVLLVYRGLVISSRGMFWFGVVLIWYSATLKHLGLVHLLNLMFCYFLWQMLRSTFRFKDLFAGLALILALVPFYLLQGIKDYTGVAFSHNPRLDPLLFSLLIISIFVLSWVFLIWTSRKNKEKIPLEFFRNGRGVLSFCFVSVLIVSFGADQWGLELMGLSFVLGYAFLAYFLRNFQLESPKALLYLGVLVTFIHGSILYFSFLGQIFANFFLPVGLVFVLSFYESTPRFRLVLALFAVGISNFSPGLDRCERWFWEWGHHYHTRGLNALHQNPLGWNPSTLAPLRMDLENVLRERSFPENRSALPVLFSGLHFHTRLQFLYPPNTWGPIPELILPEHLRYDRLDALGTRLGEKGGMEEILREGFFPIWIHSDHPWTSYPVHAHSCESFEEKAGNLQDGWEDLINDCLVQGLRESEILHDEYRRVEFWRGAQAIDLYLHRSLLSKPTRKRFGWDEFQAQWEWYQDLSVLEKIFFSKISPSERAFEYFRRANDHMEQKDWLGAWHLLRKGLETEPGHQEMLKDLAIVEEELNTGPSSQSEVSGNGSN